MLKRRHSKKFYKKLSVLGKRNNYIKIRKGREGRVTYKITKLWIFWLIVVKENWNNSFEKGDKIEGNECGLNKTRKS